MNKTLIVVLVVFGALLVGALLLSVGIFVGGMAWSAVNNVHWGMMGGSVSRQLHGQGYRQMPGNWGRGSNQYPSNGMGPGMMGGFNQRWSETSSPLSIDTAESAVEKYVESLNNPDLVVKEVMIFDNHAYAEIVEQSTGIGAMEVLVDPVSLDVYPEHGANMMWNLKYGMMSTEGHGMMQGGRMGGMMGGGWRGSPQDVQEVSAEMPISAEEAVKIARDYLDGISSGLQVGEHADQFYGYYTLHTLKNGEVVGMLSVNGFSGQVLLHTWHGNFIEMSEEGE
jgi:hypothetical protein